MNSKPQMLDCEYANIN